MTDKEIAALLHEARWSARYARFHGNVVSWPYVGYFYARNSVSTIHHIINSINWED